MDPNFDFLLGRTCPPIGEDIFSGGRTKGGQLLQREDITLNWEDTYENHSEMLKKTCSLSYFITVTDSAVSLHYWTDFRDLERSG